MTKTRKVKKFSAKKLETLVGGCYGLIIGAFVAADEIEKLLCRPEIGSEECLKFIKWQIDTIQDCIKKLSPKFREIRQMEKSAEMSAEMLQVLRGLALEYAFSLPPDLTEAVQDVQDATAT